MRIELGLQMANLFVAFDQFTLVDQISLENILVYIIKPQSNNIDQEDRNTHRSDITTFHKPEWSKEVDQEVADIQQDGTKKILPVVFTKVFLIKKNVVNIHLDVRDQKDQSTIQNSAKKSISVVDKICFFEKQYDQTQKAEKKIQHRISYPEIKIGKFHFSKVQVNLQ